MAPKRSAFMTFTLEWKNKYGKELSTPEAVKAAGNIWEKMSREQRDKYKEINKNLPPLKCSKKKERPKLTCTGTPLAEVEQEERAARLREIEMKKYVSEMIRQSVADEDLEYRKHYFIAVNFFTKVLKEDYYIPAEISLVEYSLKEGILRTYHSYTNPGQCFHGHHFEAKHHSENTHNLPLPPNAWGETQLLKVYKDVLNFIRSNNSYAPLPPVYTVRDSMRIVESVLAYLKLDDPHDRLPNLKIYSIQFLFGSLKMAACEIGGRDEKPGSLFVTDTQFERDYFEYQWGISCDFHEKQDKSKYCTQSQVTRWGYMFSDYMCSDLGISMISGRHVPLNTNLNAIIPPAPPIAPSETDIETASFVSFTSLNTSCATAPIGDFGSMDGRSFKYKPHVNSTELDQSNLNEYPVLGKSKSGNANTTNCASLVKEKLKNNYKDDDGDDDNKMGVAGPLNPWTQQRVKPGKAESQESTVSRSRANVKDTADDYGNAKSIVSMSSVGRVTSRGRGLPVRMNGLAQVFGCGESVLTDGSGKNSMITTCDGDDDVIKTESKVQSSLNGNVWKHDGGRALKFL